MDNIFAQAASSIAGHWSLARQKLIFAALGRGVFHFLVPFVFPCFALLIMLTFHGHSGCPSDRIHASSNWFGHRALYQEAAL